MRHVEVGVQGNPVGIRMPSTRCRLCMAPEVHESSLPERSRFRLLSWLLPLRLLLFSPLQVLLPLIVGSCKLFMRPCLLSLKPTCSSRSRQLLFCMLHWCAGGGCGSSCPLHYDSNAGSSSCPLRHGISTGSSISSQLLC